MTVTEKIEELFRKIDKSTNTYEMVENTFHNDCNKSFYLPIYRMFVSYQKNYDMDFMSNLRQVICYTHRRIRLPEKAINLCKIHAREFSLLVDVESNTVDIKAYTMEEDEDLKYSFELIRRRTPNMSLADSALKNHFGYDSYISLQQKCMIYLSKQIKAGETFLACLPTGSGKSLTWQAAVARGQFSNVTVVVVPTVALALDHKKNDDITLSRLPWIESIAYSSKEYHGYPEKMAILQDKIENGKNKIIYISPEGLTNFEISQALIKAAKKKNISAIVIDETHLVIDWGMNFRPEFQFLPALISKLKSYAENTITTVLLSATITESDRDVLYSIFGDEGIIEFRGDELRPELEYFSKYCRFEEDRNRKLSELIKTIPRPAIVYVGTIAQSQEVYNLISRTGIKRLGVFNSEIPDTQKEELLDKWKNNDIDIMVATSAFGMGVDKADVRTVITAYTPENISRFYQEVGRAGRDGFSALNFILYCPEADAGVVSHFTDSKVISADNLAKRWEAMLRNPVEDINTSESNSVWVNTDTPPEHLEFQITGGKNSGWNEDTISMLARASLIKIQDVRRQYSANHKSFKIQLQLKDEFIQILENRKELETFISDFRNREREEITDGKELIKQMFSKKDDLCFADFLTREFFYTKMICSGCPNCRKNEYAELYVPGEMTIYLTNEYAKNYDIQFKNSISQATNDKCFGYFSHDGEFEEDDLNELILRLVLSRVNLIVINDTNKISIEKLRMIPNNNYMIISYDELIRIPDELIFGCIVFVLGNNENEARILLNEAKRIQQKENCNVIVVAKENYFDIDEDRYLSDYTEYGKKISIMLQEERLC